MKNATNNSGIRFFFNGLKVNGGALVKGSLSLIEAWNCCGRDIPTHIVFYCRSYNGVPSEVRDTFTVENNSDGMTDYFETDRVRIPTGHPLFADAANAMIVALTRDAVRCDKRGKAQDAEMYRQSLAKVRRVLLGVLSEAA